MSLEIRGDYPYRIPLAQGERRTQERRYNVTLWCVLPLCKGELEGVVKALALCGWNLKSKIIKSKI